MVAAMSGLCLGGLGGAAWGGQGLLVKLLATSYILIVCLVLEPSIAQNRREAEGQRDPSLQPRSASRAQCTGRSQHGIQYGHSASSERPPGSLAHQHQPDICR